MIGPYGPDYSAKDTHYQLIIPYYDPPGQAPGRREDNLGAVMMNTPIGWAPEIKAYFLGVSQIHKPTGGGVPISGKYIIITLDYTLP